MNNIFTESAKAGVFNLIRSSICMYANAPHIKFIDFTSFELLINTFPKGFITVFMKCICKSKVIIKSGHITRKKYL